jgi:hypothetical protein
MWRLAPVGMLLVALSGCGGGAQELLETANFEVVQNNREHAIALYREVPKKYPDSPQARTAEARLKELEKGG